MHNIVSMAYQATRAHEAAWMAIPFVCIRDYDAKLLSSVLGQAETASYLVQPIRAMKQGWGAAAQVSQNNTCILCALMPSNGAMRCPLIRVS